MRVRSLGQECLLEEEMATHSSILAWKILWSEEPGRLQSMGSQRDTTEHAHTLTTGLDILPQCPFPVGNTHQSYNSLMPVFLTSVRSMKS